MSVEGFGERLLSEVHQQSLASEHTDTKKEYRNVHGLNNAKIQAYYCLLSDLRAFHDPLPKNVTGLTQLDSVVEAYRYEQPRQLADPLLSEPELPGDDDYDFNHEDHYDDTTSPLRAPLIRPVKHPRPVIINIAHPPSGPSAASQALLYQLMGLSVFPETHGGQASAVVFIDCTNTFSALQLHRTMLSHMRKSGTPGITSESSEALSTLVKDALQHVHVLRCTSSWSLLDTLKLLPAYLLNKNHHRSSQRRLSTLVVDGINHFHWQDRFDAEIAKLEGLDSGDAARGLVIPARSESVSKQVLIELKSIQSTFDCTVIYTSRPSATFLATATNTNVPHRDPDSPMPTLYENAAIDIHSQAALLNLHPSRIPVPQFAPATTLDECLHDQERRMSQVKKNAWYIAASGGGLSEKKERSMGVTKNLGFGLRIMDDGGVTLE